MNNCWYCGKEVKSKPKDGKRVFHPECLVKFETDQDAKMKTYIALKSEVMFQRALRKMERQPTVNINQYYEEASIVHDKLVSAPEKFDSSDEMMAAMQLLHERVMAKLQFKVGRFRVDFLLPDLHCVLEIDGQIHEFHIKKDSERETEIMGELNKNGEHWEVIRIPTKFIEQDVTKLVIAVKSLYKQRQLVRRQHNGFLPAGWSRTNTAAHIKAAEGRYDWTADEMNKHLRDGLKEL